MAEPTFYIPSNISNLLSSDTKKNVEFEDVDVSHNRRKHKYIYTFFLRIDGELRRIKIEIDTAIDYDEDGYIFDILYQRLTNRIERGRYD